MDNLASGRTAATLLGHFMGRQGCALVLASDGASVGQAMRVEGFCEVMRDEFPRIKVLSSIGMGGTAKRAAFEVGRALEAGQLHGVYNAGAATEGIEWALKLHRALRPVQIAHGASRHHVEMLRDGRLAAVIEQDVSTQAYAALHYLACRHHQDLPPVQHRAGFHILTRENLADSTRLSI